MATFEWPPQGGGGVAIYANLASFPVSSTTGDLGVAADTGNLYEFNGTSWVQIGGPSSALSLGNLDAQSGTAKGAALVAGVLSMQSASATEPGLVNTTTQSFAGNKTFTGTLAVTGTSSLDNSAITTDGSGRITALNYLPSSNFVSSVGTYSQPFSSFYGGAVTLLSSGQEINIYAPTLSGSYNINLPTTNGSTGQYLQNDGSGNWSWQNAISALSGDVTTAAGTGSVAATIAANVVTNAKLAQMATLTLKGNNTGGTANALDLTVAQVNAILPVFNSTLNGLAPLSGGGTTNFLRADGSWAVPPGAGTVTSVGLSAPATSILTVSGSPVTGSGTLAIAYNGIDTGIPYFNSSGNLVSSSGLAANQLMLGGGSGGQPSTLGSLGTTTTVLHGNASGAPSFGAVVLTTDVSGILPVANGGTGSSTQNFVDLTTSQTVGGNKTFSGTTNLSGLTAGLPLSLDGSKNVTATQTNLGTGVTGTLPLANGGTGTNAGSANAAFNALSPLTTKGDVLGFSTVNARLAVGSNGTFLTADSTQATGLSWTAGLSNPMTTLGDILYENATPAPARLAGNTTSTINFLGQTGTGSASAAPAWTAFTAPTIQKFTSSSGTYTTPTSPRTPLYIRVRMAGGGGGGANGGSASGGTAPTSGGNSTFGSQLAANGGTPGGWVAGGTSGGAGGTASLGSGPIGIAISGGQGGPGGYNGAVTVYVVGGSGGNNPLAGAGPGAPGGSTGATAAANTGGGGGGGATTNSGDSSGSGGGAGGFVDAIITSPSSTYSYAVGAAGGGQSAGSGGTAGGAGAAGIIEVTEYYQ